MVPAQPERELPLFWRKMAALRFPALRTLLQLPRRVEVFPLLWEALLMRLQRALLPLLPHLHKQLALQALPGLAHRVEAHLLVLGRLVLRLQQAFLELQHQFWRRALQLLRGLAYRVEAHCLLLLRARLQLGERVRRPQRRRLALQALPGLAHRAEAHPLVLERSVLRLQQGGLELRPQRRPLAVPLEQRLVGMRMLEQVWLWERQL